HVQPTRRIHPARARERFADRQRRPRPMLLDERIPQGHGDAMTHRILYLLFGGTIAAGTLAMVPREEEVTYAKNIAPLLQKQCQVCHQPNSIATMSLLTYDD